MFIEIIYHKRVENTQFIAYNYNIQIKSPTGTICVPVTKFERWN